MADRPGGGQSGGQGPEKGTPEYDWLYGTSTSSGSGGGPGGPASSSPDDEATQVFRPQGGGEPPRSSAPGASDDPYDLYGPRGGGDDRTQAIPAVGAPRYDERPAEPPMRRPVPPPGPPPGRPPKTQRARRRPRFRAKWILALVLLWIVFLVVTPIVGYSRIDRVDAFADEGRPDDQRGTNYLIVGSDSREDLSEDERRELGTGDAGGRRTDTIMLLHVGRGPNLLMSIPRDSNVEIPGRGVGKVNSAYAIGGPRLLTRTIEADTGIHIDHYVEIGFGGFVGLVDGVGGIEICPEQAMDDPQANLDIEAGCQEADGATALGYARSRKLFNTSDIQRAENQREVVAAIGDKALSPWSVINPLRWWRLNMAAAASLDVSEGTGPYALSRFALAMRSVNGEDGLTCGVPISDLAVTWDAERAPQMFQRIIDDETERIGRQLCTPSGLPQ